MKRMIMNAILKFRNSPVLRCASALSLLCTLLTGCVSEQEIAAANRVITALPTEVAGCTFLMMLTPPEVP